MPLLNNPPAKPYHVDTEEPLVGEITKLEEPYPEGQKDENNCLRLALDVHIETAASLSSKKLSLLLNALRLDVVSLPLRKRRRICELIMFFDLLEEAEERERDLLWKVFVDYPCAPAVWTGKLDVSPKRTILGKDETRFERPRFVSVGDVVWAVAQAYRHVYQKPKQFEVWGHAMNDLHIEELLVDRRKMEIYCIIGS